MKQYIFVPIGVPACGKTSFYMKTVGNNDLGMGDVPIHISSDEIREELFGTAYDQQDPERVFDIFKHRARAALECGMSVYLDATHMRKDWREYAIKLAKRHGAACVAFYFDVPFLTLLKRDKMRRRHVGFFVLLRYFFGIQAPTKEEGFDTVLVVDKDGEYTEKR